ncbi:hypothetical protein [Legionella shakespearei]|uniref:Uncharacterized protein n=1 Tax=Legionella shakespearei DSM 23087 TaxID=1122169 RepID=A0A0W0YQX7_9GAMM|nr:hypothetical protein [Legionella shakespearei]KTD59298.1 hypothetical protein Lsha_1994 [Legionella shakespearei DSM 23087]
MKYQLVIQFPEHIYGDLDWIAEMEDRIDESLIDAEIDGHDIGNGEVNIFIHANNPINSFEVVKDILEGENIVLEGIKAAYRELSSDHYIPLWPENLVDFKVV